MAEVWSVSAKASHAFSKSPQLQIRLLAGLGVEGDAHCGEKVKHRSRARQNPDLPNLRQVHLLQGELLDELETRGHRVAPGDLGENITTRGIDLLGLPVGARLAIGESALVEITGLRNPCSQIERFERGLLAEVLGRDAQGRVVRKSGIMGVVLAGGEVQPGDRIAVTLPDAPHRRLQPV